MKRQEDKMIYKVEFRVNKADKAILKQYLKENNLMMSRGIYKLVFDEIYKGKK